MKTFQAFLILLISLTACSKAMPPEDAAKHVGESATVKGKVSSVSVSKKGDSFLNFGGIYPNQVFTAYIPPTSRVLVGQYDQKVVAVSGKIQLHKGKPEIIVSSPSQIKILP